MTSRDEDVYDDALAWIASGHQVALATVIETWGSSPRPRGSHLVVRDDGVFLGSVSGGCVEGKVIEAACALLPRGAPVLLDFGVSNQDAWSVGLACGGKVQIRVEAIDAAMRGALEQLALARRERRASVMFTPLERARPVSVWQRGDAALGPDVRDAAARALERDEAFAVDTPDGSVFVRPVNPSLRLFVIGAVHIAGPLATMARELGYAVTIVDPRGAFTRPERWPGDVTVATAWPDEALADADLDDRTAVVALTHDPKIDDVALQLALKTKAFYVGALGSKKSHAARLTRLAERGVDEAARSRVHGPVGLAIGALTPAEIAVSIIAEMTEVLRRGRARARVAGVVVAAGLSSRMGGENKLLAEVGGKPIVARVVDALLEASIDPVLVVVGHQADLVRAALVGRRVQFVHNRDYGDGLGTSIRAGFCALGDLAADAAVFALGDMPQITAAHVAKLVAAFEPSGPNTICVPVHEGRRGHPVLWSSRHFAELRDLAGDVGARSILERHAEATATVPIADGGIHFDVDAPDELADARARVR
jgi:xanthine dehydrogenase accessory factor